MTEPVNVTLDIASYGMEVPKFIAWIRDGLGGEFAKVADDIEAQVKPAIEEPLAFASVVKVKSEQLYVRTGALPVHPWESGEDSCSWSDLDVVEVLRVGLGCEYSPSLQQIRDLLLRSPSGYLTNGETLSAYRDLRKGLSDLLSAEPLTEIQTELVGLQERRDIEADAYKVGERIGATVMNGKIHNRLQEQLREAITSERKSALERAIQAVEELAP